MYKIVSVTDKSGNVKLDFIDDMKSKHGDELLGDFVNYEHMKNNLENKPCCCFEWADNSGKMLRTSRVDSMSEWDNKVKIATMNSVYVFEKVE
jgi:hypothetical protein